MTVSFTRFAASIILCGLTLSAAAITTRSISSPAIASEATTYRVVGYYGYWDKYCHPGDCARHEYPIRPSIRSDLRFCR